MGSPHAACRRRLPFPRYRGGSLIPAAPAARGARDHAPPAAYTPMLVSCLMPTRDRRQFIPAAIRSFLAQEHQTKELLIDDDGADPVADLIPPIDNIVYIPATGPPATLGTKLNRLASIAHGPILCNWDDDDISGPRRITTQLEFMQKCHVHAVGFSSLYYWDTTTNTARLWQWHNKTPYACGSSQMYTREWAIAHPLPDITLHVDSTFSNVAAASRQLRTLPGQSLLVARYHHHSAWRFPVSKCGWPMVRSAFIPAWFWDLSQTPRPPDG